MLQGFQTMVTLFVCVLIIFNLFHFHLLATKTFVLLSHAQVDMDIDKEASPVPSFATTMALTDVQSLADTVFFDLVISLDALIDKYF